MTRFPSIFAAALAAVVFAAPPAFAATPAERHEATVLAAENLKIEALIAAVEAQPKAVFIRNGSEHSAAQAAAHLRMKRSRAGDRIRTADEFITQIASASSITGRKYRIRLESGREMDAEVFFRAELAKIEAKAAHAR
jgi:hypothetical protein